MGEWSVRWSAVARHDLLTIAEYIAEENPAAAAQVLERLRARADSLDTFPRRGRTIAGFSDETQREYRELIEAPWRILYWIAGRQVQIIAVVDGRRDFVKWLDESRRLPQDLK